MEHSNAGPPTPRSFRTGAPSQASSVPATLPLHTLAPISSNVVFPLVTGSHGVIPAMFHNQPARSLSSVGEAFGHRVEHAGSNQVLEPGYQSCLPEPNHSTRPGGFLESGRPDTSIQAINHAQSHHTPESGPQIQPCVAEHGRYTAQANHRLSNSNVEYLVQDANHAEYTPQTSLGEGSEPGQPHHVHGQLGGSLQATNSKHALPGIDHGPSNQVNDLGRQPPLNKISQNDGQPVDYAQAGSWHGTMHATDLIATLHRHPHQAQQPAPGDGRSNCRLQPNPQSGPGVFAELGQLDHVSGHLSGSLQVSSSECSLPGVDYGRSNQFHDLRRQLLPSEPNRNDHPAQSAHFGRVHQSMGLQRSQDPGTAMQPMYTGSSPHKFGRQACTQIPQYGRSPANKVLGFSTVPQTSIPRERYARPALLHDGDPTGPWRNEQMPDPTRGETTKWRV
jgi:hypothetical protein